MKELVLECQICHKRLGVQTPFGGDEDRLTGSECPQCGEMAIKVIGPREKPNKV